MLLSIATFLALAGCTTVQVTTDYSRNTDFSKFQTFSLYQERPAQPRDASVNFNQSLDNYLRSAIRQTLSSKGLRFDSSNPDLKVAYDVAVNTEVAVNTNYTYPPGFGYGYSYWYGYRYDYGFNNFPATYKTINQYKEGTVVVDLINPDTNELVWRGVGEAAVDMTGGIDQEKINKIVSEILKEYPPKTN